MLNRKVLLKKNYAKWHLDHPEIYFAGNSPSPHESYDSEMQLHIMSCMGACIYGRVVDKDGHFERTYLVDFSFAGLKMSYWVERKNVEFL